MPSEAIIYAARPGLRLWKTDINGMVDTTLIFTNSSAKQQPSSYNQPSSDCGQTETETAAVGFPCAQFGLLQVFCDRLLVSYTSTELLVVSPQDTKQKMFMYTDVEEGIVDVAVNNSEMFVLRKTSRQHLRPLVRLTQRSLCSGKSVSPSVALSASCVYAKPHRECILHTVY